MRQWILVCLVVFAQSASADGVDNDYSKLVDRYVAATAGGFNAYVQYYSASLAKQLVRMKPMLPSEAESAVRDEIATMLSEWFSESEVLAGVYEELLAKSLSKEDLEATVAFYESETGQRLVALQHTAYKEAQSKQLLFLMKQYVTAELGPRLNGLMERNNW